MFSEAVATNKEPNTLKMVPDSLLLLGTTNLGCLVLAHDKQCLLAIVFTLDRAEHKTFPCHLFPRCNYLFHRLTIIFFNLEKIYYLALVLRQKTFFA